MSREVFERQRDRFLGEDEIAYRFRRAKELMHGSAEEIALGVELATETLACAPYDVDIRRELAVVAARAGDAEALFEHLVVCVDMGALELSAVPELCGTLDDEAFAKIQGRLEHEWSMRTRAPELMFETIPPQTATLVWSPEHDASMRAAFSRLLDATARTRVAARRSPHFSEAREWLERISGEKLVSPLMVEENFLPTPYCVGHLHAFFREIAPYVQNARFVMYDWHLDEVWIIDGAFHVRRHPIEDSGLWERAELFTELLARWGDDPWLNESAVVSWFYAAHIELEANEARRSHADGTAARAEHAIASLRALGRSPDLLEARLHLFRNAGGTAAEYLERALQADPNERDAHVLLARQRLEERRFKDALRHADRALALRPDFYDDMDLVRAIALESLGRAHEANPAYQRHAERLSAHQVVRDGHALIGRGFYLSARLLFAPHVSATAPTCLDAELGLARCAAALGDRAEATRHFEQIFFRSPALRATHAANASMLAAITTIEAAARNEQGR